LASVTKLTSLLLILIGNHLAGGIIECATPGGIKGKITMADHSKTPQACNPTMELALSAACVSHGASSKHTLSEALTDCTDEPVTIDYLAGFHSGS
jgi:hypothetical protein